MPDLIADALDCVGEKLEDWLELEPVDPLYRAYYPDGSTLDVQGRRRRRWPTRSSGSAGPTEAHGYLRYVDFVSQAVPATRCRTSSTATSTRRSTCSRPNLARLVAIGGFGRLAPKVEQLPQGPAHPAGPVVPVDVRRAVARTTRSPSTRSSPTWTRSPASTSRRAACTRSRGRWPARPRSTASSSATARPSRRCSSSTAARSGVETDGRRAHPRRRRGAQPRPAGRLPRAAAARGDAAAGEAARYSPSLLPAARRIDAGLHEDRAPQHPLRAAVGGRLRRAHRQAAAHERPVDPRHQPDPQRPVARAGRQADLLRAAPDAEHRRAASTGASSGRATATRPSPSSRPAATSASATPSRSRTSRRPPTGSARGMERGAPFAAAHSFLPDRAVPADATSRRRSRAWCSPAPARSPASACRWCSSPAGSPPSASSARTRATARGPCGSPSPPRAHPLAFGA